jgi:hypothetical protein
VLTLPPSVKIYLAAQPVDARKSFDGLAGVVEAEFGLSPLSGHLFVFLNRRAHVAQILFWDRNGFCVVKKRLEAGTFRPVRVGEVDRRRPNPPPPDPCRASLPPPPASPSPAAWPSRPRPALRQAVRGYALPLIASRWRCSGVNGIRCRPVASV